MTIFAPITKMKPHIKKKWVSALRSGDFTQTTGTLRDVDAEGNKSYCCLGVLCEIHRKSTKKSGWNENDEYCRQVDLLPIEVMSWAGLVADGDIINDEVSVEYKGRWRLLTSLNDDDQLSFKQIATVIDRQL
jgi:hypothetical protein